MSLPPQTGGSFGGVGRFSFVASPLCMRFVGDFSLSTLVPIPIPIPIPIPGGNLQFSHRKKPFQRVLSVSTPQTGGSFGGGR